MNFYSKLKEETAKGGNRHTGFLNIAMLATVASERNNTLLLIPTLKALKNMLSLTKNVSWLNYCQQLQNIEIERTQTKHM